jgi:hypothetical protein
MVLGCRRICHSSRHHPIGWVTKEWLSDLVIIVWNGYQAGGRGGTADVATYARSLRYPFVHIHTRLTGFRASRLEKLLDFYSHPEYVAHKVHILVAYDLEWDHMEMEDGEEIWVHTFTLEEALAATRVDYRCDPEAALALWLYRKILGRLRERIEFEE